MNIWAAGAGNSLRAEVGHNNDGGHALPVGHSQSNGGRIGSCVYYDAFAYTCFDYACKRVNFFEQNNLYAGDIDDPTAQYGGLSHELDQHASYPLMSQR